MLMTRCLPILSLVFIFSVYFASFLSLFSPSGCNFWRFSLRYSDTCLPFCQHHASSESAYYPDFPTSCTRSVVESIFTLGANFFTIFREPFRFPLVFDFGLMLTLDKLVAVKVGSVIWRKTEIILFFYIYLSFRASQVYNI